MAGSHIYCPDPSKTGQNFGGVQHFDIAKTCIYQFIYLSTYQSVYHRHSFHPLGIVVGIEREAGEWDNDDIEGYNRAVLPLNWKKGGIRGKLVYRHLKKGSCRERQRVNLGTGLLQ